jgi:hypothetical protein
MMKKILIKTIAPLLWAGLFLAVFSAPAYAEEILVEDFGYYMDIPEGWQIVDAANPAMISFTDPSRQGIFQVIVFPGDSYNSVAEAAAYFRAQIKARGDEAAFVYQGREALIADYSFKPGNYTVRGWFIFLSTENHYFALSAFCEISRYETFSDALLSCADSFAPEEKSRLYPGPVSQFYHAFPPPEKQNTAKFSFGGSNFELATDSGEIDANSAVIEREARILAAEKNKQNEAWQRYYRIIYRDSYMRLLPITQAIKPLLDKTTQASAVPGALLSWFQGFSYSRTGTLADFQSPLDCVLSASGDCDSLGMADIILLRQMGFDAILLVSEKYKHALAAVDIPGGGARFDFEGKPYLIAELTDKVSIGLIDSRMADPAFWLPVALGHPVKP